MTAAAGGSAAGASAGAAAGGASSRAVPPTLTTLVTGPRAAVRESAIAAAIEAAGAAAAQPHVPTAVILEGLADANSPLVSAPEQGLQVLRIAPGCLCCAGNLVLRVTLNRLLRRPPAQLYISLANAEHVDQLRTMLLEAPYGELLALAPDMQVTT
ncbi:GTPase [Pseudoduganella sp. LjRoot289]|uniref:GTPase n=1 Tax=Pseudoduganella sp. LjRoot289 TaxID=3342314 RepID=UPI003ECFD820